jgi:F-type H+-transporting ATPase subunit a
VLAALKFPPIGELVVWKTFWLPGFNKVALLFVLSAILTLALFLMAGRKRALVPTGVQNIAEAGVEFIWDGIIMQTMGEDGMYWAPFLTTMFFFILFANLFEVIPFIQFPPTARMAVPASLGLLVWALFNIVGIKRQGFFSYIKANIFPPGVPTALYILVTPIEFISTFIVRPFSLAVRLFANELAGHLLLVTFAVLSAALVTKSLVAVILPLPAIMLVLLTGFEVLVAVLQAFIFTILTAVYIGGAMHPDH